MMETVWEINVERFVNESRTKSIDGRVFSLVETCELIIERYEVEKIKPMIVVNTNGIGQALSDMLKDKKIPHTVKHCLISRIGSADILKYRE